MFYSIGATLGVTGAVSLPVVASTGTLAVTTGK